MDCGTGDALVGKAHFFASNSFGISQRFYAVCYTPYVKIGEATWAPLCELHICDASCIRGSLCFLRTAETAALKPIFPRLPGLRV